MGGLYVVYEGLLGLCVSIGCLCGSMVSTGGL